MFLRSCNICQLFYRKLHVSYLNQLIIHNDVCIRTSRKMQPWKTDSVSSLSRSDLLGARMAVDGTVDDNTPLVFISLCVYRGLDVAAPDVLIEQPSLLAY